MCKFAWSKRPIGVIKNCYLFLIKTVLISWRRLCLKWIAYDSHGRLHWQSNRINLSFSIDITTSLFISHIQSYKVIRVYIFRSLLSWRLPDYRSGVGGDISNWQKLSTIRLCKMQKFQPPTSSECSINSIDMLSLARDAFICKFKWLARSLASFCCSEFQTFVQTAKSHNNSKKS